MTEHLGRIYAINTLGAILGSLLAGFVLIPTIGLHLTIRVGRRDQRGLGDRDPRFARIAARADRSDSPWPAAVLAAIAVAPHWDRSLLSSGAYKYAPAMRGSNLEPPR